MAYPNLSSYVPFIIGTTDGPTLTAAAAASCIPTANKTILPASYFTIGKKWNIKLQGRMSVAVTGGGTWLWDLRLGSAGSTVCFSTGAIAQNAVAKTTLPWELEINLTCRAVGSGTSTNFFGIGRLAGETFIGAPLPAVGGCTVFVVPVTTPAVGSGFDNTVASIFDMFVTPSVATGSLTVHNIDVYEAI
jgi:hypothetical protein